MVGGIKQKRKKKRERTHGHEQPCGDRGQGGGRVGRGRRGYGGINGHGMNE